MRQGSHVKASVGRCRENQERKEERRNGKTGREAPSASPIEMGDTSRAAEKNRSVARSNLNNDTQSVSARGTFPPAPPSFSSGSFLSQLLYSIHVR